MKRWTNQELKDWKYLVSDGSDITITACAMRRFVNEIVALRKAGRPKVLKTKQIKR